MKIFYLIFSGPSKRAEIRSGREGQRAADPHLLLAGPRREEGPQERHHLRVPQRRVQVRDHFI